MEDITDIDHRHAKRVFKNLSNDNLGDYQDLYVQSDTLLLTGVFENFRNMCIKVYELYKDFYKDIADDVEKRFDTSNYEVNRPLPTGKNKKVIGLMKDELEGKILKEFVALRPKTYSYFTDDWQQ